VSTDISEEEWLLVHRLADERLLVTALSAMAPDRTVEVSHEALLRHWSRLKTWLDRDREFLLWRERLRPMMSAWTEREENDDALLQGAFLVEAEKWRIERNADLSPFERRYVETSVQALATRRKQARRFAGVAGAGIILLLAVIAATAISVARAQEPELQREVLRTNAYAAHALAGAVAFHLREQIDAVVATASDPAVARLLHDDDREALERRRIESPFETIALYDLSGTLKVHAPPVSQVIGKGYAWRDYFRGVRPLGQAGLRAGYISRALHSEDDGLYKFGIAAPIYDGGAWVGVLMATIGTDFALKRKRLDPASEAGPMAVVVAPRDRSRDTTKGEGEYVVLLHEGLPHGAEIVIDSPRLRELRATRTERKQLRWPDPEPITDDAHRDPVPGFEGRWLAGFAPVGDTGFVVIVQTRHDAAVEPNARLSRRLASRTGVVLLAWTALCTAVVWFCLRRWPNVRPSSLYRVS